MNDFYIRLEGAQVRAHLPGQIFWLPAPIISKDALGLRLGFLKQGQDITDRPFTIVRLRPEEIGHPTEAERVEFYKRMPLPEINLSTSEDLLITKVKKRPSILLFKGCVNLRRFAILHAGLTSKPVNPNHYVFAPIYSLRKEGNIGHNYPEKFIVDLQNNKFPNLLFLPAYKNYLPNDSVAVLDDLFGVGIQAFKEKPLCIHPLELASKLDEFNEFIQGKLLMQAEENSH